MDLTHSQALHHVVIYHVSTESETMMDDPPGELCTRVEIGIECFLENIAVPDGIIECECCGIGCLEIKCPYCYKDASPKTVDYINENLQLKQNHMYYYQVQAQIHICQVEFADFVIWSPQGLHIERIVASEEFFTDALVNVEVFYKYCLLPELAGKWYTRKSVMPEPSSPSSLSTTSSGTPNPS